MSITLKDILTFTFALLIGYSLYPLLNTPAPQATESINRSPAFSTVMPVSESSHSLLQSAAVESISPETAKIPSEPSEVMSKQHSEEPQQFAKQELKANETADSAIAANKTEPEQLMVQQELDNWTARHKADLREKLQNNVPASIVDGMLEQVEEDNPFLDKPEIKQDSITDEQWAFLMEQEIRDVVQQHALSNQLELFSVTCKQLTCELTGKELVAGTWHQVFLSLFSYIIESGKQLAEDSNGKNVSYLKDELTYFYSQFIFAAN